MVPAIVAGKKRDILKECSSVAGLLSYILSYATRKKHSESALKLWQNDKSKSPFSNRPAKLRL